MSHASAGCEGCRPPVLPVWKEESEEAAKQVVRCRWWVPIVMQLKDCRETGPRKDEAQVPLVLCHMLQRDFHHPPFLAISANFKPVIWNPQEGSDCIPTVHQHRTTRTSSFAHELSLLTHSQAFPSCSPAHTPALVSTGDMTEARQFSCSMRLTRTTAPSLSLHTRFGCRLPKQRVTLPFTVNMCL